ncbi:hypothetical protein GCM10022419_131070 [Nonomuraea rosea]|uniref:Integrase n=1 Tax=Nonomuraea rosea TaxID=638574 RepID=A0ABP7A1P2_9ACTN
MTTGNVYKNFRRFLWQARISHGGRGHGPRVRDLHHPFAVNNLRRWFAAGEDTAALLPVLQAYMGHCSISDTAYGVSTRNQRLAAISSFCTWMQTEDPARMACWQDILAITVKKQDTVPPSGT